MEQTRWTDLRWQTLLILNKLKTQVELRNQERIKEGEQTDEYRRDDADEADKAERGKFAIVGR